MKVSTHSRPKAADPYRTPLIIYRPSFNTQPPEGGWHGIFFASCLPFRFNTQPPEGGWFHVPLVFTQFLGFNTQPPEGG